MLMDEVDAALDEANQHAVGWTDGCVVGGLVAGSWAQGGSHHITAWSLGSCGMLAHIPSFPRTQVARLFDSLSSGVVGAGSGGGCAQILCVSHNAAFQARAGEEVAATVAGSATKAAAETSWREAMGCATGPAAAVAVALAYLAAPHLPPLQALSGHVVSLTRGPQGTQLAGEAAGGAARTAAAGRQGGGGGKARGKKPRRP